MFRALIMIFAVLACSGCQHSSNMSAFKTNPDALYFASGINPVWTLKVSRTSITYQEGSTRIHKKIDPTYFGGGEFRDGYAELKDGQLSEKIGFWTIPAECFDHKARRHLLDTVTVQINGRVRRGCGGLKHKIDDDHLNRTIWYLEEIDGVPVQSTSTQIRFSYGLLKGFVGCNHFSNAYTGRDGVLTVQKLPTRTYECSDEARKLGQRFLEIIGKQAEFQFARNGDLIIQHSERGKLRLSQTR